MSTTIPVTTRPVTTRPIITRPIITRAITNTPEITIIKEALRESNDQLQLTRYDIIDKQKEIQNLTNRLNNLQFNISSLKQKSIYTATGELNFY